MTDSPLLLAYLGDAVMEVLVRKHLIGSCRDSAECNQKALAFVTASAQSSAIRKNLELLSEEERAVFTRAKNSKSTAPRNIDVYSYRLATGLEAVFGFNSLNGREERNKELFRSLFFNE